MRILAAATGLLLVLLSGLGYLAWDFTALNRSARAEGRPVVTFASYLHGIVRSAAEQVAEARATDAAEPAPAESAAAEPAPGPVTRRMEKTAARETGPGGTVTRRGTGREGKAAPATIGGPCRSMAGEGKICGNGG